MTRRPTGLVALLASLFVGLALLALPTNPANAIIDRDCGDFDTQAAAQNFFLDHGGPQNDPHRLDADGDGIVCESNPCPCSTSLGGSGGGGGGAAVVKQRGKIIRVVDGDTVDVNLRNGPNRRVRLIGIDTPEVYGGTECGGEAASRSARQMLPRGTRVLLVSDPTQDLRDRYDRLLRYVMKSKVDVNRRQVLRGHARVYVYNNNPFKRVGSYRDAQRYAKNHDLGIWGSC
jgi:endonuclease YncB( thermonuclease family)